MAMWLVHHTATNDIAIGPRQEHALYLCTQHRCIIFSGAIFTYSSCFISKTFLGILYILCNKDGRSATWVFFWCKLLTLFKFNNAYRIDSLTDRDVFGELTSLLLSNTTSGVSSIVDNSRSYNREVVSIAAMIYPSTHTHNMQQQTWFLKNS